MYDNTANANGRIISADSHFLEPPHIWRDWLPQDLRDRAPQLVDDGTGGDAWLYAGASSAEPIGLAALPGRSPKDLRPRGVRFDDAHPGTYDGSARVADQDRDGVNAEIVFPTARPMSHFLNDPDRDFVMAGVQAYNRFSREEFCGAAPDRLYSVAQLPSTGVEDCITVLESAAGSGYVGAVLPCWPSGGDHLTRADAEFWRCAEEVGLPICIHVSLRSREERLLLLELSKAEMTAERSNDQVILGDREDEAPPALEYHLGVANVGIALGRSAAVLSELLLSGLFEKHPALRVGLMETWIGWIPRILEALDDTWYRNRHLLKIGLDRPPSCFWGENVVASFLDDNAGVALRSAIGVENMLWSTDFPHFCTFWPRSVDVALESLKEVPRNERDLILGRNCERFFGLPS